MRILAIGGTGTVGGEVVRELLERGAEVRVLTRDPGKVSGNVQAVAGDLVAPESLPPAFDDIDKVFLLTPLDPDEARLGKNAVRVAADRGVPIVFQSVHDASGAPQVPLFRSKVEIGLAASREDLATTRDVLGREPRSFEAYAGELVAGWKAS